MKAFYTEDDLRRAEMVVQELHGLKGFDAWAERIAQALAEERGRVLGTTGPFQTQVGEPKRR